jgi:cobalamin biosynthesis protein CbiD
LGIQYHGAKGAGFRIHWVEPLSANLVETIFQSVLELTKEYREHLYYIRSKNCSDFLPKSIDDIGQDFVEIDDLIGTIFGVKDTIKVELDNVMLLLKLKNIPIYNEIKMVKG